MTAVGTPEGGGEARASRGGAEPGGAGAAGTADQKYLATVIAMLEAAARDEAEPITAAADAVASALGAGRWVHTFGTGHGHMLAEELFYRAGGTARVNPILVEELMLHAGAARSSLVEREPGLAATILADHPIEAGDVLIVASNSGGNRVVVELAGLARAAGATVIALTSLAHARSPAARHVDGPRLHEMADIVLDNHGVLGDAVLEVPGLGASVAPTSTVVGAGLLQAVMARAVTTLAERGIDPEVFVSSNTRAGDSANAVLIDRYADRVRAL